MANLGSLGLSDQELKALLLLASHAGKVVLVYASLKNIPVVGNKKPQNNPKFKRKEYLKLLEYYNNLAKKSEELLQKKNDQITLKDILGDYVD